jgi:DNA polymerase type B, organellar and viral
VRETISPPDPLRYPQGRKPKGPRALTGTERKAACREKVTAMRHRCIAVLDMETDPFDNLSQEKVFPFVAVLYSDQFETLPREYGFEGKPYAIIWEEHYDLFTARVLQTIEALPDRYTIYAHNGGKFDFLFLVHALRGAVKFKGRGIMCACVGNHELRDSFHIIPERLAAFQKDKFDYTKLKRNVRSKYRDEIIRYCIADCVYLFSIVKAFIASFGLKLSIGQAAMACIKQHYTVEHFSKPFDALIRDYFFGGRVECIQGAGLFKPPRGETLKLIDVNSLYPHVMAAYDHPIGGFHDYTMRSGPPSNDTVYIRLRAHNHGALVKRGASGETTATEPDGEFFTTIWEYNCALRFNLISDVDIISCFDCAKRTNFAKFVLPLYENRLRTKRQLAEMKASGLETTPEFFDVKKDDIFYKLLLNNGYGKFAQNPENYREHYITDPNEQPEIEWLKSIYEMDWDEGQKYLQPAFESDAYWIWSKPSPSFRYNNIGTAASITGAARAVLLEALQCAENPIYCDTDSIICNGWRGLHIDKTALGAWDMEDEYSEVIVTGKKLYSVKHVKPIGRSPDELRRGMSPDYTIKSKGTAGLTWADMLGMLDGAVIPKVNFGPTLTKKGTQHYLTRQIKMTALPPS